VGKLAQQRVPGYIDTIPTDGIRGSCVEGVQFVINDHGEKMAVLIDLKMHGDLWEDFYDSVIARQRAGEPRESLESVKKRSVP